MNPYDMVSVWKGIGDPVGFLEGVLILVCVGFIIRALFGIFRP